MCRRLSVSENKKLKKFVVTIKFPIKLNAKILIYNFQMEKGVRLENPPQFNPKVSNLLLEH